MATHSTDGREPVGREDPGYDDSVYRCGVCGMVFQGHDEVVEHGRVHVDDAPSTRTQRVVQDIASGDEDERDSTVAGPGRASEPAGGAA